MTPRYGKALELTSAEQFTDQEKMTRIKIYGRNSKQKHKRQRAGRFPICPACSRYCAGSGFRSRGPTPAPRGPTPTPRGPLPLRLGRARPPHPGPRPACTAPGTLVPSDMSCRLLLCMDSFILCMVAGYPSRSRPAPSINQLHPPAHVPGIQGTRHQDLASYPLAGVRSRQRQDHDQTSMNHATYS
jgi:hypothetical protein